MNSKRQWTWIQAIGFALAWTVLSTGCQPSTPSPTMPVTPPSSEPPAETPAETPANAPAETLGEMGGVEMPAEEPAEKMPAEDPAEEAAEEPVAFEVHVPLGLPPLPIPEDNPMTAEKVELGKMLYFDTRLSKDGTLSCATCHDPKMAWAEDTPTSSGIEGQLGDMNSPTVINSAYATSQFWDGRAATLEEQALGPIENPVEMGHDLEAMIGQLNELDGYREHFQKVFGTDVTRDGIAKAIATFERTVLSGNSPYDKYMAGDEDALTDAQKRGMELFNTVGCADCHTPPLFSGYDFYNAGIGMDKNPPAQGRMAVTSDEADLGAFRVPPLREVANTAPYFHDGSVATLEEAVALMAGGGIDNPNLSVLLKLVGEADLTEENQADLVEFLKALSGEFPIVEPPELP